MTARIALLLLVANATTLVANAATLAPASVPAAGRQEVLLTLDAPAALHLSARSASGTSCETFCVDTQRAGHDLRIGCVLKTPSCGEVQSCNK